jgi:uncharacterized membrane protein YphA (DoxX/SURF4 family)
MRLQHRITEIIASLLVILFTYAALSKLLDYGTFRFQLGRSPYLTKMAGMVAWAIPAAELITVAMLVLPCFRQAGLYASFFLLLLFSGYIYAMLHFSYYVPCSCGGVLSRMSWNQHFIFNLFFTALSLGGILLQANTKKQLSINVSTRKKQPKST